MATSQTSAYRPGFIIGQRYEVIRLVRQEPYGEVWLVNDQLLDVEVGLKVLSIDDPHFNRNLEYYRAEAAAGLRLNQPQILGVHHLDETSDCIYLVQEPFEGATLLDSLGSHERLSVPDALYFIEVLGKGLVLAHKRGIIHQNFNPLNVLVSATEGVKLANFAFPPEGKNSSQPRELKAYIPPEVIRGQSPTPASNLFSLGVLSYRMLAGVLPYPLTQNQSLPYQLDNRPEELDKIPTALQPVFTLCLAAEPGKRFQNLAEFLIWLNRSRELLGGEAELRITPSDRVRPLTTSSETGISESQGESEPEKKRISRAAQTAIYHKFQELYPKLKNICQKSWDNSKVLLDQGWAKVKEFYQVKILQDPKLVNKLGLGAGVIALLLVIYFVIWGVSGGINFMSPESPQKAASDSTVAVKSPAARLAPEPAAPPGKAGQSGATTPAATAKTETNYRLLVATYQSPKYALKLVGNLQKQGYRAYIRKEPGRNLTFYQVWLPPFPTEAQAQDAADFLKANYNLVPKIVKVKP
ncbi:MAG: protein kinase [Desulfobacca sp.]|nr:protein kinase [Desulfobacca sp.]